MYSREDRATGEGEPEQEWQCHARGVLTDSSDGEHADVDHGAGVDGGFAGADGGLAGVDGGFAGTDGGLAGVDGGPAGAAGVDFERLRSWPPVGGEAIDIGSFYEDLAGVGLEYGPVFQGLTAAWRCGKEVFAEVALGPGQAGQAERFGVHPALFDAALHAGLLGVVGGMGEETESGGGLHLPFSLRGVRLYRTGVDSLRVCIGSAGEPTSSITALDDTGAPVLSVASIVARPLDTGKLKLARRTGHDPLYRPDWVRLPLASPHPGATRLALLGDADAAGLGGEIEHCYADLTALEEAIGADTPVPDAVLVALTLDGEGGGGGDGDGGGGDSDGGGDRDGGPQSTHTGDADPGGLARAAHVGVGWTLGLVRAWLAQERLSGSRLVLVTRGAVALADGEPLDPVGACVCGLVRSAQSEHPGRLLLVDLPPGQDAVQVPWPALLAGEEPQVALRDGDVYVPRLARFVSAPNGAASSSGLDDESSSPDPDGTVLITGGTGALGVLVARHLAREHGARNLLLLSRRGAAAEGASELVARLAGLGCVASVAACDIADRDELSALIDSIPRERPLTAVFHAAGVLDDGTIESLSVEQVERVMRPKVDAVVHLHELTRDMRLSDFVLFSSVSGVMGSPGQANYAAANAFMDAFAQYRRAQGLAATSLAWGLWSEGTGMAEGLGGSGVARARRLGLTALSNEEALRLLDVGRASGEPLLVPVMLDMTALHANARVGLLPAQLRGLVRAPAGRDRKNGSSLARLLDGVPRADWDAIVLTLVRTHIAAVLGHESPDAIDPERAFKDLGFDSLAAVELRNLLEQDTGLRLPATIVFDHPTPAEMAKLLCSRVDGASSDAPPPPPRPVAADEPIAIVGMSCRYPGGVRSPEDLWRLLSAGVDAVSSFPTDRGWDLERLCDPNPERFGASYVREGGFLYDAGDFDADFFGISPREAVGMDPQQRLFLEGAWEALETAGIDPRSLKGSQTGVFAGVMYNDYGLAADGAVREDGGGAQSIPGVGGSLVSGRVAYTLGLEGPTMTVDTACSSSLVALHLACQALRGGECSLALAGGVTVLSTPAAFVAFSQIGGLAVDGRCKSFADSADGMGWSEGAGLLALERLSDARRLGHPVLAMVRGSAVNQDGASNGLTAPNGPSQERVIRQALANAGLAPDDVDAVEAHGTGTPLGDPIEAQALLATYGQRREGGRPLLLGSIKSNLGHTQAAAGVAGVIKIAMALRHERLPKTLHVDEPTAQVDWTEGMVSLLTDSVAWPRVNGPRRAGVSSFGMSGTNAHLIVEEAPALDGTRVGDGLVDGGDLDGVTEVLGGVVPWVISARAPGAVRSYAARLCDLFSDEDGEGDSGGGMGTGAGVRDAGVSGIGLSLARRSVFEHRAVVVGSGLEQLRAGLEALSTGALAPSVLEGVAGGEGRVAFLFTGQGAQRVGMGRELYLAIPLFRSALDEICARLDVHLGCSLLEVLFAAEDSSAASLLDGTMFAQAGLFALEASLFRVLEAWGVRPAYLIGHSIGELAAAFVAGVFSLEDACKLVAARGRLMSELPSGGSMVAVQACEEDVLESLLGYEGRVALAAVNGPEAVVLSGDEDAVSEASRSAGVVVAAWSSD